MHYNTNGNTGHLKPKVRFQDAKWDCLICRHGCVIGYIYELSVWWLKAKKKVGRSGIKRQPNGNKTETDKWIYGCESCAPASSWRLNGEASAFCCAVSSPENCWPWLCSVWWMGPHLWFKELLRSNMYYMLSSCSIGGKRRAQAQDFYAAANGKGQPPIRARLNNIIFTDSAALGTTMKRKCDTELGVNDIPASSNWI